MISLIIPCYNEEESLPFFIEEIDKVMTKMKKVKFELIFVNDGSKDKTLEMLIDMASKDNRIKYISFSRNFGKEAAMLAGLEASKGDYIAVMDADLQDPPSILIDMYKGIVEEGYDCVATRRVTRKGEPVIRSFFARLFYKIINRISDADITDGARDFRLMKRDMVDAIVSMGEHNRFSKGIFGWVGFRTCWIPYENTERVAGTTKWNFWKLFKYSIDGIMSFSNAPISLITALGIVLLLTGAAFAGICIAGLVSLKTWTTILLVLIVVFGLQFVSLGVVGKYIMSINSEVKKRPHYIISQTNDSDAEKVK